MYFDTSKHRMKCEWWIPCLKLASKITCPAPDIIIFWYCVKCLRYAWKIHSFTSWCTVFGILYNAEFYALPVAHVYVKRYIIRATLRSFEYHFVGIKIFILFNHRKSLLNRALWYILMTLRIIVWICCLLYRVKLW